MPTSCVLIAISSRARTSCRRILLRGFVVSGFGIFVCALSGCAISYQSRDGRQHVIGLVKASYTPVGGGAVQSVETQTIGLMVHATDASQGLSVGYNRESILYPTVSDADAASPTASPPPPLGVPPASPPSSPQP